MKAPLYKLLSYLSIIKLIVLLCALLLPGFYCRILTSAREKGINTVIFFYFRKVYFSLTESHFRGNFRRDMKLGSCGWKASINTLVVVIIIGYYYLSNMTKASFASMNSATWHVPIASFLGCCLSVVLEPSAQTFAVVVTRCIKLRQRKTCLESMKFCIN